MYGDNDWRENTIKSQAMQPIMALPVLSIQGLNSADVRSLQCIVAAECHKRAPAVL